MESQIKRHLGNLIVRKISLSSTSSQSDNWPPLKEPRKPADFSLTIYLDHAFLLRIPFKGRHLVLASDGELFPALFALLFRENHGKVSKHGGSFDLIVAMEDCRDIPVLPRDVHGKKKGPLPIDLGFNTKDYLTKGY